MLKQKLILSYGTKLFLQFFQIAVTIVVARIAGASVLGTIAFATSYVSLFLIFFDLGQGVAHIKLISEGKDADTCNGIYFRIQFVLSLVFLIVVIGFLLIQKYILKYHFETPQHEIVIWITIITVMMGIWQSTYRTTFNAYTEQAKADVPDFLKQIIYNVLRLLVVVLGYKAIAIALSNLIATILIMPVIFYLFKGNKIGSFNRSLFKEYVIISLPVFVTNIVEYLMNYSDKVFLQYWYNSAEVGFYAAGFRIGGFILLFGNSIGILFLPTFSKHISEKKFESVNNIVNKYERFCFIFLFPLALFSAIYADVIVKIILGNQYLSSIPILGIINLNAFLITYFIVYGNIISANGSFKTNAKYYLIKLAIFMGFSIFLSAPFLLNLKGIGFAIALSISNLIVGILFVSHIKNKIALIKVIPNKALVFYALFFSITALLIYNIIGGVLFKIVFGIMFFVSYWGLLFVLRLVSVEDFKMLMDLINIKKMKQYIKGEIFRYE